MYTLEERDQTRVSDITSHTVYIAHPTRHTHALTSRAHTRTAHTRTAHTRAAHARLLTRSAAHSALTWRRGCTLLASRHLSYTRCSYTRCSAAHTRTTHTRTAHTRTAHLFSPLEAKRNIWPASVPQRAKRSDPRQTFWENAAAGWDLT